MSEKTAQSPSQGPSPIGEISQEPSAFEAFLDAHQKKLIIVGILAIIGLIAYVIVDGLGKISQKNAAADVAAARTVPDYEKAAEKHPDENAGGSALMLKAQLQWRDQQQEDAIKTLEEVVSNYPEHPALDSALSSLGSYQQQLGNIDEARKHFEAASALEGPTSSLSLLALGDIASQAGETEKAREIYNSIITKYSTSHPQVKTLAEQRLEIVGVQPPAEGKPKPPAPTPGAPNPFGAPTNPLGLPGNTPPAGLTPPPALKPTPAPKPAEEETTPPTGETDKTTREAEKPAEPVEESAPNNPDTTPDSETQTEESEAAKPAEATEGN